MRNPLFSLGIFSLLFLSSTCSNPQIMQDSIDKLEKRVKELEKEKKDKEDSTTIQEIKNQLLEITKNMATGADLNAIQEELKKITTKLQHMDANKADKTEISTLNDDIKNLKNQINVLQKLGDQINALEAEISTLNTNLFSLQSTSTNLGEEITKLKNETSADKASLAAKIQILGNDLNQLNQGMKSINDTITQLGIQIKALQEARKGLNVPANLTQKLNDMSQGIQSATAANASLGRDVPELKRVVHKIVADLRKQKIDID